MRNNMQLKNRVIDGVLMKVQLLDNTRSTCYKCGKKGTGIKIITRMPVVGTRHLCFDCFIKDNLGDVIQEAKKKMDILKKAVEKQKKRDNIAKNVICEQPTA